MTRITQAAYARQHGVSRAAVGKWKSGGYVEIVDGLVAVEASDARLRDFGLGRFNPTPAPRLAGVNSSTRPNDPTWIHAREYPAAWLVSLIAGNMDDAYLAAREHVPAATARLVAASVVARAREAAILLLDEEGPEARPRGFASWHDHLWFAANPHSEEDWRELEAMHSHGQQEAETAEPAIELPAEWVGR
jgi:hypothetical protein